MSRHRRTADSRPDLPTQAVLGVAISERAAGLVVLGHGDGATVACDAMHCPDRAHLLAVLAEVEAHQRSATDRGYDITAIAFTWTTNVDDRARQLAEWLTTVRGTDVVMVEHLDAVDALRGEHESPRGTASSPVDNGIYVVPQQEWSRKAGVSPEPARLRSSAATVQNATRRPEGVTVVTSAAEIDIDDTIVPTAGAVTSTVISPAEAAFALARGAAQAAMRTGSPQRARPPRGRTLVKTAAVTASVGGVLLLTAGLMRLIVMSEAAPTAPPVGPGTEDPDASGASSVATQPTGSVPSGAAGSSPSAIEAAQSTQAHYLRAPESAAGPSVSASPPPPSVTAVPLPPQEATQPPPGSPDVPTPESTDAQPPPPAPAPASQSAPPPTSEQPESSDTTPSLASPGDSGPVATPPPPSAADSAPPGTP